MSQENKSLGSFTLLVIQFLSKLLSLPSFVFKSFLDFIHSLKDVRDCFCLIFRTFHRWLIVKSSWTLE